MKYKIEQYLKNLSKKERQFTELSIKLQDLSIQKEALWNSQQEKEKTKMVLTKNIENMRIEVEKWKQKYESQTRNALSYQNHQLS